MLEIATTDSIIKLCILAFDNLCPMLFNLITIILLPLAVIGIVDRLMVTIAGGGLVGVITATT